MTCEVEAMNSLDWKFIWYRNGKKVEEDDPGLDLDDYGSLNITSASQDHRGVYTCKAQLETTNDISESSNSADIIVYGKLSCLWIALH